MLCFHTPRLPRRPSLQVPAFALGLLAGGVYGLLYAKSSGQELRSKLKQSDTPFLDFLRAGEEANLEFIEAMKTKYRNYKAKRDLDDTDLSSPL